jgi:antirestriction protein ArdC
VNVYEIVTEQIIAQLEAGTAPWRKPWTCAAPCNLVSQKDYRGLNVFMLASQGMPSKFWLTANQAAKLGGTVKAGAKSCLVVYWRIGEEKLNAKTGKLGRSFLLRYSRVHNLSQTEGIAEPLGLDGIAKPPVADIEAAEQLIVNMPNRPRVRADLHAYYRPSEDIVGIPDKETFHSSEGFYATLFHELGHSTGHTSRLGREGIEHVERFGSQSYSREELIAEMTSAYLCGITGIAPVTLTNSAAYLQSWIKALKGDSRLIVTAASAAQKSADYIRGISATDASAEA